MQHGSQQNLSGARRTTLRNEPSIQLMRHKTATKTSFPQTGHRFTLPVQSNSIMTNKILSEQKSNFGQNVEKQKIAKGTVKVARKENKL